MVYIHLSVIRIQFFPPSPLPSAHWNHGQGMLEWSNSGVAMPKVATLKHQFKQLSEEEVKFLKQGHRRQNYKVNLMFVKTVTCESSTLVWCASAQRYHQENTMTTSPHHRHDQCHIRWCRESISSSCITLQTTKQWQHKCKQRTIESDDVRINVIMTLVI